MGKGEGSCALEGCQYGLLTAIQQGQAFGPSRRDVGEGQRIHIASLRLDAAMGAPVPPRESQAGSHSSSGKCGSGCGF